MRSRLSIMADPMIAVLFLATGIALFYPATGESREAAQIVSNTAIFVLFLVNGMRIARSEIAKGLANWRFFVPLFVFVFGAMPLLGLGLSQAASGFLPPVVALGFLYLGILPSTVQSATSYTSLAGGNIALSVVSAALINIAGVFLTAPLFALLAGGEIVTIGTTTLVRIGLVLVLPFLIGQLLQGWVISWLSERKKQIAWLDRLVIGTAVYVAFSGAVEEGLPTMFDAGDWGILIGLVLVYLLVATVGAWLSGHLTRGSRADRIAFLFAGAQKSVAIGAPLAAILFPSELAGFVIVPLLLYHLLQLLVAAPVAAALAND